MTNRLQEHPDFALIRSRWRYSLSDGSFNRWFYEMNPPISRAVLIAGTALLAATLVYFRRAIAAAKIVLSEERASRRRREAYWNSIDTCEIRLAFSIPKAHFFSGFERQFVPYELNGVHYFRVLIPENRVISIHGWDSEVIRVFERFWWGSCKDSESREVVERLKKRGPLTEPLLLPAGLAGERRIWAVDLQMERPKTSSTDSKSVVVPCLIPEGNLSAALPLPQFLIVDFREMDQELRRKFKPGTIVIEQFLQDPDCADPIEQFVTYLKYEDRSTFSREEAIIFGVFEVESEIRGMGIENAIASLTCGSDFNRVERFQVWSKGLAELGLEGHHKEAEKVIPYLESLKPNLGDEHWEYDDVHYEVHESFPTEIKYMDTEALDVSAALLRFATKNRHLLRRVSHPTFAKANGG